MGDAFFFGDKSPDGVHLILHKGDQRGYYHCRAFHQQGRKLVAKAFAATGRHKHEGVVAPYQMLYDIFLLLLEVGESEELLKVFAKGF